MTSRLELHRSAWSASSRRQRDVCARVSAGRGRGFTLVEILLVVSILVGLAAIVVISGGGLIGGAKARGTKALLERIRLHIEDYRSITGRYPPDGIDWPVRNAEGTEVKGIAALYHALTTPIETEALVGGLPRTVKSPAVTKFPENELGPVDEEYPGAREIFDPFGSPLHYDNTVDGRFQPQSGEVHIPPVDEDMHPVDPRTLDRKSGGVDHPGRVQTRTYDLWSLGERGWDLDVESPKPPIANWNINE